VLVDRWRGPLLGFFRRSLGSHADAEDLTLEVFVRLHRAAPAYTPRARFPTFLFHIARNLVLNERRRRRREPTMPTDPGALDHWRAEAEDGNPRAAEVEEIFQQALQRLPERYRVPLLAIQQRSSDYPAVAAVLNLTENALRVRVHRGRQMLKSAMHALS